MAITKKQPSASQVNASPLAKLGIANQVMSIACRDIGEAGTSALGWQPFLNSMEWKGASPTASPQADSGPRSSPQAPRHANLYITDLGINQWDTNLYMGDDFGQLFSNGKYQVMPDLPKAGQILIPMPPDEDFNRMTPEQLTQLIFSVLKSRVDSGLVVGNTDFEIRLVQNINAAGYFSLIGKDRQEMVRQFGQCAYEAIGKLNKYLHNEGVDAFYAALWGSNGATVGARNTNAWRAFLNCWYIFDGRASIQDTDTAIDAVGAENAHIFNTFGDYPDDDQSVGNHAAVKKWLKAKYAGLTCGLINPLDKPNIVLLGPHIRGLYYNSKLLVSYFDGDSYTDSQEISGSDLRPSRQGEHEEGSGKIPSGKGPARKRPRRKKKGRKRSDLAPPFFPPPPPPPIACGVPPQTGSADDDDHHPPPDGPRGRSEGGNNGNTSKDSDENGDGRSWPRSATDLPLGGVSTEEFSKAFVDRGSWPVLTVFGLGYRLTESIEGRQ
ncbi:MAG: hypothetical protein MUO27_01335 [Sedimentisphaerales bacterium]|nr:hypothetical protein [Sedimentisphaerales bacterium]